MIRGAMYTCTLVLGCTLGVTLSYASVRDSLKPLIDDKKQTEEVSVPTMLAQDGVVTRVDTQGRAVVITTALPYDQSSTASIRTMYGSTTTFWDQFGKPASIADVTVGSTVRISIERTPGAFHARRILKL